ncbi:MAG: hypothetical protein QOE05_3383 [Actinomycetota bacterium]|jgi:hypothetical protein|nr:hypothetical protein [Actinomycetota bacterium]
MAEEKDVAANDPVAKPKAPRKKAAPAADPEQIAADIERTREELAETLDAIAEKVSPKRVAKRTTKKVTDAVKDTAHDAADAVSHAKDKVTGGGTAAKPATDWAPDPGKDAVTAPVAVPDLTSDERREVTALPTPPSAPSGVVAYPSEPDSGSLIKKEYVVAGAAAGLLAWLILRKRK